MNHASVNDVLIGYLIGKGKELYIERAKFVDDGATRKYVNLSNSTVSSLDTLKMNHVTVDNEQWYLLGNEEGEASVCCLLLFPRWMTRLSDSLTGGCSKGLCHAWHGTGGGCGGLHPCHEEEDPRCLL